MHEQPGHSPLTLFYSYADKDEKLCQELEKHLSLLQRQGVIAGWHHRKILPGEDLNQANEEQFSSAQVILLLISPDFLASDAAHIEMERALQRHEARLSYVIPLLLRPVDYEPAPFARLQVLPHNGRPVTRWKDQDEAFANIAKDVRLAIEQWNGPSREQSQRPLALQSSAPFLCSARKDLLLLKRVKKDLQDMMREENQQATQKTSLDEEEQMREAIRSTSAVIVVASPYTRRSLLVRQALEIALMYQRTLYVFWMQGDFLQEVLPTGYGYLPSIDARGERYEMALQDLVQALSRQIPSQDTLPEEPGAALPMPRNPYKGLQAFRIEDAQDFFGRDRLIEELIEKVQQLLTLDQRGQATARLLTVLGPSGSGKSSVVMAGLLPRLKQGALAGSASWTYLDPMVPGKHPLEALTLTLTSLFPERSLKSIREDLEDEEARGLHLLLATSVKQSGISVLLVIDQLEELFTQTATEGERQQFLNVLLAAISEPHGPLMALLALRADFYDRPLQYPELGHLIKSHQVIIFPMETPDLRKVIEQPAQLPDVQLTFEEGLVGDLLFDVQGQVGALPLLQFALGQLFQHREGRILTQYAYQQIGGVKGALGKHAEATYQSLPTEKHQRLTRALFLRLINPGTLDEDATKRRIPLSELIIVDQEETARLTEVTNTFTKARLLTTNTIGETPTVEVSHEALIGAWSRLESWVHEARDAIRLQQIIGDDAAEWQRHGQPADRLYQGSQLVEALAWRNTNLPSLDEDTFLQASVQERQKRRRRFTRRTVLAGAVIVTGLLGTGFLGTLLRGPSPLPPKSLPYAYTGHTYAVFSVAWSPDGKRIASGGGDKTVKVWDANTGETLFTCTGHTGIVFSVTWAPDGTHLASGSGDNTVRIWDGRSGQTLLVYRGHTKAPYTGAVGVNSVAWSPDGQYLASAGKDETVRVWKASGGQTLLVYQETNLVNAVTWSLDGKRLASSETTLDWGSDSWNSGVRVWDVSSRQTLCIHPSPVDNDITSSIAWAPDGEQLASASGSGSIEGAGYVQVWDASNGHTLLTYTGHTREMCSVAWSLNGKYLASAGYDRTVQVWDASKGATLFTYTGHIDTVLSVAWAPDGKRLASGSADRTVQVWEATINTGYRLLMYTGHDEEVNCVAWSPDSKQIASGGYDGTVRVWVANSGYTQFITDVGTPLALAWSPDGTRLASGGYDQVVHVWNASNSNATLFSYTGHTWYIKSVMWSPDGKRLASASEDSTVRVWDANSGNVQLIYRGHAGGVSSVSWSPDGKYLASGGDDKAVNIWDANTGQTLLICNGHTKGVNCVDWSPNGKYLASGSLDNTARIWDVNSGRSLHIYITSPSNPANESPWVESIAWSPNSKYLATVNEGTSTVLIWDTSSDKQAIYTYTGHAGSVQSVAWAPDGERIASAGTDTTVQVWLWVPNEE